MGCLFCLPVILTGCNTTAIYQDDRYNPPVYWGRHVVQQGETLYSISMRYGRDYRELGDANGLSPPYHLDVGQVIRLDVRGEIPDHSTTASRSATAPKPSPSPEPDETSVASSPSSPSPSPTPSQSGGAIDWRWPGSGTVLAGYSTSGKVNKGIDLDGQAGDPVRAAAHGKVVYAGNGLLGYGNLIIINHNERYLSAYAHNRAMLVKEGEDVAAGQTIAEMGSSGTSRTKLHFEIRKNGEPVNPLGYLPER
ncbi:peptidoglycan DD-metalloendopeptidase family protein [Tamilnaduibacter salinus]